jgi:UDP-N-acetylenolpyruvoylglucosamine reductase
MLAMSVRGGVVTPDMPAYELLVKKQHSASFHSRQPAFFVRCHTTEDVAEAVKFCAKHEMPIAIRSGGHSACGSSLVSGAVVLDLSALNRVDYDPATEMARIGPGATLHDINVELMRHERMAPIGVAPPTGCGGLVLHGGVGTLQHRYGASVDQVEALTIVLADGSVKQLSRASEGDDRELFFAARGTAGALGVVTEFTMRTYPMEMVTGGLWIMLDDDAYSATRALQKKARDIVIEQEKNGKRSLFGLLLNGNAPPLPHLPEEVHGKPISIISVGAWGTDEETAELVAQFQDRDVAMGGPPGPMPYNVFNQLLTALFMSMPSLGAHFKGQFIEYAKLSDECIDTIAARWADKDPRFMPGFTGVELHGGGAGAAHGAKLNEGNDHSAAHVRQLGVSIPILTYYQHTEEADIDRARQFGRSVWDALKPYAQDMTYCNYFSAHDDADKADMAQMSISGIDRVKAVKAKVDPKNMFNRTVLL